MAGGKVLGIGGVFLRADDPAKLSAWYREHLGFTVTAGAEPRAERLMVMEAGGGRDGVFVLSAQQHLLPDRPADDAELPRRRLEARASRLKAANIDVERRAEWDHPSVGRFARIHYPEGNPIELWEPPADGG